MGFLRIHRRVWLPCEHGSWVRYLVPLVIGIAAGHSRTVAFSALFVKL